MKTGRFASLPSVSQLKNLIDEESAAAMSVPQAKPVPQAEEAYRVSSPAADLPTLEQLTRLKTEAEADFEPAYPNPAPAVRRSAPSFSQKREKSARPANTASRAAMPVKKTVKPKRVEPIAETAPVRSPAPARRSVPAVELPTLDQLQSILSGAYEPSAQADAFEENSRPAAAPAKGLKYRPAPQPVSVNDARVPERAGGSLPKSGMRMPERSASAVPAAPKPYANGDKKEIPSLEQLRSLLAMEQEYGDFSFQERVREIRQGREKPVLPEEPAIVRRPAEPAEGKVRYIPYETFEENAAGSENEEKAASRKKPEQSSPAVVPEPEQVEPAELKANDEEKGKKSFFVERKPRKEKRKTGTARLPYWLSSLLRSS